MIVNKLIVIFALTMTIASLTLFASCSMPPSKERIAEHIGRNIKIGSSKTEVLNYIDKLEISGSKAFHSGYFVNESPQTIPIAGKEIDIAGTLSVSFRGQGRGYCGTSAIFYFDKSERLVTYSVDNIYC